VKNRGVDLLFLQIYYLAFGGYKALSSLEMAGYWGDSNGRGKSTLDANK
jgi:hypothetical protein